MNLSRRSFLAALAAAVAVDPRRLILEAPAPAAVKSALMPYCLWGSALVEPGATIAEKLWFPPVPAEFLIKAVRWNIHESTRRRDMEALLDSVALSMMLREREYIRAPLSLVASLGSLGALGGGGAELLSPVRVASGDSFSVGLSSREPVMVNEPVEVRLILDGLVKVII